MLSLHARFRGWACRLVAGAVLFAGASAAQGGGVLYEYAVRNNTGQAANDLHVRVEQLDALSNPTSDQFTTVSFDGIANTMDFSGGTVPNGGQARVSWEAFVDPFGFFTDRIVEAHWTLNGANIGGGTFAPISIDVERVSGGWQVIAQNHGNSAVTFSGAALRGSSEFFAPGQMFSNEAFAGGQAVPGFPSFGEIGAGESLILGTITDAYLISGSGSESMIVENQNGEFQEYIGVSFAVFDVLAFDLLGVVEVGMLIPEPGSLGLIVVAGVLLGAGRRRRR